MHVIDRQRGLRKMVQIDLDSEDEEIYTYPDDGIILSVDANDNSDRVILPPTRKYYGQWSEHPVFIEEQSERVMFMAATIQQSPEFTEEEEPKRKCGNPGVPIICIDTNEEFPNMAAAANKYGISTGAISNAVKKGCKCVGMKWKRKG